MATSKAPDERIQTNAIVYVARKKVDFVWLSIEQEYGDHHYFEICLDYHVLQDSLMKSPADLFNLIDHPVSIDIQHGNDTANAYVFKGIITGVIPTAEKGRYGYILIKGASPTIMLEQGKRLEIYSEMTIDAIFEQVTSRVHQVYMQATGTPTYKNTINFVMQHNESDWKFLQRLAQDYGENLFFSGSDILFGEYDEWKPEVMTYNTDIIELKFGSRLLPNAFTRYHYQAENDTVLQKQAPEGIENSNQYIDKVAERSVDLTEICPPKTPSNVAVRGQAELDELVAKQKTRTAARTNYITGESNSYKSTIGRLINIKLAETISEKRDLGTYRVIKSIHKIDQNHIYSNSFEAVPASLKVMPMPEIPMPVAGPMRAEVINNTDPEGYRRVQVRFPFAQNRCTHWMRVVSPHAGSSSEVERGRGMNFTPEKGDQVMVDFEYGNPNFPFVSGSLFHGKNASDAGMENYIKSIISRMGLTFELDDNPESLGITLKDKKGNYIHIDTKGNNIELTAVETVIINAKDIKMNASNNIEMKAEQAIKADAMAEVHIGAQANVDIATEANIQIKSVGSTDITAKSDIKIEGKAAKITSASDMEISGKETVIKGQSTKISGASHKIEIA
ncbi:uncharacterized protein involved in type VI secretion and phage assembly [Dysgonomonas alginatilytica]|uniref:Uncharacterized protein involved in type VI secretion and phage assembly n=1 Tax=Dysgonomonas alginatilytica TaxID=1605892 RepID=A0A2V3PVD7_9BACT|nr:phage baseplate assembly protein V [Dysgonomonas alginatilytica]PXV63760.1 uncharacterized protein involved in type VI secretion and phage assembly [Dysgonomonas alginatilytica]